MENQKSRPGKLRSHFRNRIQRQSDNLRPGWKEKVKSRAESMPACFNEMWDVFLSFTRLNY
jgi:hypothetical protein